MTKVLAVFRGFSVLLLGATLLAIPVTQQGGTQGGAMDNASPKSAKTKQHKQARWEGVIVRSDKNKKMLTVRQRSSGLERYVAYDDSTSWTSQEHNSKKVNPIDPSQVNDSDRVICLGTFDKNGVLHATLISKRLTE